MTPEVTTTSFIERATKPTFAQKIFTPANIAAGIGGLEAASALQRGREEEEIFQERAAIALERAELDKLQAEAVRRTSVERARILRERGDIKLAQIASQFITKGVRKIGVPLLAEAQARADIAKGIGFDLETGRVEAGQFLSAAEQEKRLAKRYKKIGKQKRKRSRLAAIGVAAKRSLPYIFQDLA